MHQGRPSQTAAFVAACRALGECLPADVRLFHDPLGWRFAPPPIAGLRAVIERFPGPAGRLLLATPLRRLLLWIQLRTRAIDDVALDFVRDRGRQIVLLGAGFDCRPVRLAPRLEGARFFEVDHPSTQARKRALLESAGARPDVAYLPWDLERDPLARLPSRLRELGLDPSRPTLTIWEGVIPYLTEPAVEATLAAVRALGGGDRSRAVLHYIERRRIESRTVWHLFASRVGEPLRFGWDPEALPAWLRARGFELLGDRSDDDLARELFAGPASTGVILDGAGGRIALARPAGAEP